MLRRLLFIVLLFVVCSATAQTFKINYHFVQSGDLIQDKNFYLLTLLQKLSYLKATVINDANGESLQQTKLTELKGSVRQNKSSEDLIATIKFSDSDKRLAENSLANLVNNNHHFKQTLLNEMKASGYFILYENQADSTFVKKSLGDALEGINGILNTYGLGIKGRFTAIDAPTIDVSTSGFHSSLKAELVAEIIKPKQLFFEPALKVALYLLKLNKCDQPGFFEPLNTGENKKAIAEIAKTNWSEFRYAAQLVPGNGPQGEEKLSKTGIERLRIAVENYQKKLAPFIIVSGGNVHPFRTKYNEGYEMKKELMNEFHIPESAIILEPHARHTTTNLRNCNRIFYRYNFPVEKKILISTDKNQAFRISNPDFVTRCESEIQHVPFTDLKSLSANMIEYQPVQTSLFMDSTDPLDP